MIRRERYSPNVYPPNLLERVEIERLSPVSVRFRRYDGTGALLENRKATVAEAERVGIEDDDDARQQAKADFVAGVNALPGANPMKVILQNLIKARRWD